jgi:serine/threonine protein kinase
MELSPEQRLGAYRLMSRIGVGGMGEVWRAEDTRLRRTVAIKVLPPALAANAESQARLLREARTAAQLNHPNVATIHSIEQEGDRSFIVMEFVSGEPLSKLIARGPLPEAQVSAIGREVAVALGEASRLGIVHRDVKPDNIIVSGDRVKVLDFGIAKQTAIDGVADPSGFKTEAGMVLGTVFYMSPEQAMGKTLDGRSDLFSLGVVMYEALTGRLPFRGDTMTETLTRIIRDDPPELRRTNPSVSPAMSAIIARCLHKEKDRRYSSAGEVVRALDGHLASLATLSDGKGERVSPAAANTPTIALTSPIPSRAAPARRWVLPVIISAGALLLMVWMVVQSRRAAEIAPASVVAETSPVPMASAPPPATPSPRTTPVIIEEAAAATPSSVAVTAASAEPQAPPTASELYETGLRAFRSGDRPEAVAAFMAALKQDPHYAPARMRVAHAAMINGQLPEALRQYKLALADRDQLSEREVRLAQIAAAIRSRQFERARDLGLSYDTNYPNDPEFRALEREVMKAIDDRPVRRRRKPGR